MRMCAAEEQRLLNQRNASSTKSMLAGVKIIIPFHK
jgi:hypothetical protein